MTAPTHGELIAALAQADAMCIAAIDVLGMLPSYGVYNERGMVELRQAVCDWLGAPCGVDGGAYDPTDARGFEAYIAPFKAAAA